MSARFLGRFAINHDWIKELEHSGASRWIVVLAAIVFAALVAATLEHGRPETALSSLPNPEAGLPFLMISSSSGEFPSHAVRLLLDSSTISPSGPSPVISLIPVLDKAENSVLVLTESGEKIEAYGALSITREERAALASYSLPPAWRRDFSLQDVTSADETGILMIGSSSRGFSLYIEPGGRTAYFADNRRDMERIRRVQSGQEKGVSRRWSLERGWGGHLLLYDGGIIGAVATGLETPLRAAPLSLEAAWRSAETVKGWTKPFHGEARWQLLGLEEYLGRAFIESFKKYDWSAQEDLFIPSPLIISGGVNLPNPGKNTARLPRLMKIFHDHLSKMGLSQQDAQSILTGPSVFSIGGRTQILWFDLPGIVLDLRERGKTGLKLVDRFWSETFMGIVPKPVGNYESGGITDLPFSVFAAANDRKVVIGLTEPSAEQNADVKKLLADEKKSITGWLYVDFPRLGASIAEMPSVNILLEDEDGEPVDDESSRALQESLSRLGSLFVVWDSVETGHASWN
jgi:hypothetical protein